MSHNEIVTGLLICLYSRRYKHNFISFFFIHFFYFVKSFLDLIIFWTDVKTFQSFQLIKNSFKNLNFTLSLKIIALIFYSTLLRYNLYIVKSTSIKNNTKNIKNSTAMEYTIQCVNCKSIFLHMYPSM